MFKLSSGGFCCSLFVAVRLLAFQTRDVGGLSNTRQTDRRLCSWWSSRRFPARLFILSSWQRRKKCYLSSILPEQPAKHHHWMRRKKSGRHARASFVSLMSAFNAFRSKKCAQNELADRLSAKPAQSSHKCAREHYKSYDECRLPSC